MRQMSNHDKRKEVRRTKKHVLSIAIPASLCILFRTTGKLEGNFEFSQTFMLLYLCIKSVLEEN